MTVDKLLNLMSYLFVFSSIVYFYSGVFKLSKETIQEMSRGLGFHHIMYFTLYKQKIDYICGALFLLTATIIQIFSELCTWQSKRG